MTTVLTLNPDGSYQEIVLTDNDGGSIGEINCGGAVTEPNPTTINCGGA